MRRQLNNPLMEDYVEYLNRSSTETAEAESLMCYDQFVNALEKGKTTPISSSTYHIRNE